MSLELVSVPGVTPAAPYSPGIKAAGFLFISGQVGREGGSGHVPEGIEGQTRACLENVQRIVEAGGSSMDRVVRMTVYLTNMNDFAKMNEVYRTFFPDDPPTRTTIGVTALAHPDFLIEVDAIALA
jgi:2-iminobutanoate/2-iminopropanoate deaminase